MQPILHNTLEVRWLLKIWYDSLAKSDLCAVLPYDNYDQVRNIC